MLPLPSDSTESLELADWLEMNALVGRSGQASLDDMRNALRIGALGAKIDASATEQPAQLEGIAAQVKSEIDDRVRRSRQGYPFKLRGSSLERTIQSDRIISSTYGFCLLLSWIPWEEQRHAGHFPDRMFEELSCLAARHYVGGKSVRFGWPRHPSALPGPFAKAVEKLSERIKEGTGYRADDSTGKERDASLDVVAWRPIDERSGKLLLFGACATGRQWEDKLDELHPHHFCSTYFLKSNFPKPAKAFFTPRVISRRRWEGYSSRAGVLFDRCRVSQLIPKLPTIASHGDIQKWMELAIGQASAEASS